MPHPLDKATADGHNVDGGLKAIGLTDQRETPSFGANPLDFLSTKLSSVWMLAPVPSAAGAAVQWLRDSLGIIKSASEIEDLAAMVETTGGVYFVPVFNGLFAPWWREDARVVCIGITRFTNKSHIARAVLESMCFQVKDVLDSLNNEKGEFLLRVDGGATANNLLMHIQVMTYPLLLTPVDIETTALGAAYALHFFLKMLEEADVPTKEDNIVYKEILKNLCEA
ncbi:unnamed protein product [Brassica oleracea]